MGRHNHQYAWGNVLTGTLLLVSTFLQAVRADLPISWTYPQQCTPINITWTADPDAFPYSVYVIGLGSNVQTYRIEKDYQPNSAQITFQYLVQLPTPIFNSFVVSVADSKGNGNTSDPLPVNTGADAPSNCAPYTQTNAFLYASDSLTGQITDRPSCGTLAYYPVAPYHGTAPFSFTLLPLGQTPITVNIPSSATQGTSNFNYRAPVPFKEGTSFMQFMSDGIGGGSGGASPIYITSAGNNSDCLASGYKLPNVNQTHALPTGSTLATFQNLPGAIPLNHRDSPSTESSHRGLIGGIIGAVIGVGAILVIIAAYLVYRRREKKRRELERKERPQFVDLDDDEYNNLSQRRRNRREGVQQSYSVDPFTYVSAAGTSPPVSDVVPFRDAVDGRGAGTFSSSGPRRGSTNTSDFHPSTLNQSAVALNDRNPADSHNSYFAGAQNLGRDTSLRGTHRSGSESPPESAFWQSSARADDEPLQSPDRTRQGVNDMYTGNLLSNDRRDTPSGSHEMYLMRGTTHRESERGTFGTYDHARSRIRGQDAGVRPGSGTNTDNTHMIEMNSMRRIADPQHNTFMQHQDAGPVQPEDFIEEMPPSYGQWISPPSSASKDEAAQAAKRVSEPRTNDEGNGAR